MIIKDNSFPELCVPQFEKSLESKCKKKKKNSQYCISKSNMYNIEINDEPVEIHMKLGDSGEAYFLEECDDDEEEED
ncbi:Lipin-3 [Dermatophagoides farinae]|uniref:Lipin-3 n=1 Tax=Dermatophagoides farinae TaxID=6954 RepID=A0A922HT56_DERFA|nr:Lipin-3 [Dermatophagoides farinae]